MNRRQGTGDRRQEMGNRVGLPTMHRVLSGHFEFEIREIDRSYYHAHVYRFPVTLFRVPDGRPVIAHCPQRHDTLHIELLDGTWHP